MAGKFTTITFYVSRTSNVIYPGSKIPKKDQGKTSYSYFKIGTLQAPQNKFFIKNNSIFRNLYGKDVLQTTETARFKKWLKMKK